MPSTPEKRREYMRAYREANRERLREQNNAWREANREKIRERQRRYRAENREHIGQRNRDWYAANREQQRAAARKRHQDNRSDRLAKERRRRHGIDDATWSAMWQAQDGRCYLCQQALIPGKNTVVEHWHGCPAHGPSTSCRLCQRGLACGRCNLIVGQIDEDTDLLRLIAANLEAANTRITNLQHHTAVQLTLEETRDDVGSRLLARLPDRDLYSLPRS